ncbi:MAG: hypothetical protein MJ211_12475 [Bacteroidales bacterium]|nr:hypothetical protein [Bacteroidales bacterium]
MERNKLSSIKAILTKKNLFLILANQISLLLSVFFGYSFFPLFGRKNYTLGSIFIVALIVFLGLLCATTIILTRKYDNETKKSDFDSGRFIYLLGSITLTGLIFTTFALIISNFYKNNQFFIPGTAGIGFVFVIFCIFSGMMYLNYLFATKYENTSN